MGRFRVVAIVVCSLFLLLFCRAADAKLGLHFGDDVTFEWDAAAKARGFAFQRRTEVTSQPADRHPIAQPVAFQHVTTNHDVTQLFVSGVDGVDIARPDSLIQIVAGNPNGYNYYRFICPRHFRSLGDVMDQFRPTFTTYRCVHESYVIKTTYDVSRNHTFSTSSTISKRMYHALVTGGRRTGYYYVINDGDDLRMYELDLDSVGKEEGTDDGKSDKETSVIIIGAVLGILFAVVIFIICVELGRKALTKRKDAAVANATTTTTAAAPAATLSPPEIPRHDVTAHTSFSGESESDALEFHPPILSPPPMPEVEFFPFMASRANYGGVARGRKAQTTRAPHAYVNMTMGGDDGDSPPPVSPPPPEQRRNICIVRTYTLPRVPGAQDRGTRRGASSGYQNIFIAAAAASSARTASSSSDDVTRVYAHNVICNPMDRGSSLRTRFFPHEPNIYEEMTFVDGSPNSTISLVSSSPPPSANLMSPR